MAPDEHSVTNRTVKLVILEVGKCREIWLWQKLSLNVLLMSLKL